MSDTIQNGKGDKPINCHSEKFKENFDNIKGFGYKPKWQLELEKQEKAKKKPKKVKLEKKTSSVWLNSKEFEKVRIIDPDGWDRENWEFSFFHEKITKQEFESRLIKSTIKA